MKLEDKMKLYPTIQADHCKKCGNRWYFKRPDALECTTCGDDSQKETK